MQRSTITCRCSICQPESLYVTFQSKPSWVSVLLPLEFISFVGWTDAITISKIGKNTINLHLLKMPRNEFLKTKYFMYHHIFCYWLVIGFTHLFTFYSGRVESQWENISKILNSIEKWFILKFIQVNNINIFQHFSAFSRIGDMA